MTPQGLCTFAGGEGLLSASFTLTAGVSPSMGTLYIAPRPGRIPQRGPLVFSYGGTRIVFPDCRLEALTAELDSQGREVWRLSLADRRWKWKRAGRISGRYNVRRAGDRETIIAETQKPPRELARLCLVAMGERRFDVSRLPNETRPEIDWDYDLPSEALARLCDALGCRVVLGLDNSVSLAPVGVGQKLPQGTDVLAASELAQSPPRPEALVLVCGRTRWQHDFRLEAVGLEVDGSLLPIDELSYAPRANSSRGDWCYCDLPHFQNVSLPQARGLARQSVFRYYRIATPFSLPLVGGKRIEVDRLDRILPVESEQIQTAQIGGERRNLPAWVFGVFHGGSEATRSEVTAATANVSDEPRGLFAGPFSLDRQRGLVIFAEPVFRYFDAGPAAVQRNLVMPAELWLRTSVSLRDGQTGGWLRHEVPRGGCRQRSKAPVRYIRHDELALGVYQETSPPRAGRMVDNLAQIEAEAARYLGALAQEQQSADAASVSYAGLKPIELDGAIQNITWTISADGFATTRASH